MGFGPNDFHFENGIQKPGLGEFEPTDRARAAVEAAARAAAEAEADLERRAAAIRNEATALEERQVALAAREAALEAREAAAPDTRRKSTADR